MTYRNIESVIGVPVDAISATHAQDCLMRWGHEGQSRYVVLANVHVVVTASIDSDFGAVVVSADMATPDGAPVAWMLRRLGHQEQKRVSGPDLTWVLLERCAKEGLPVYFFGSTAETLKALVLRATSAFKELRIAGYESPPFRALTEEEDAQVVQRINASGAGLVFVGLGCPKQENWMLAHRGRVNAVMLGVGAAFDFHAGTLSRAPLWMREHGLEWLHRLATEPRRLWKRYLVTNSLFILMAFRQLLRQAWLQPICAFAALAMMAVLFIGGAQPIAVGLVPEPWDKLVHALAFASLAALLAVAFKGAHLLHGRDALSQGKALVLSAFVSVLVAGADEIHQIWLPGRVAGWDDWLADVVGMALALALVRWLWRRNAGKAVD